MKIVLSVELACDDASLAETTESCAGGSYAELVKEFDLDFAPYEMLKLQFSPIMSDTLEYRKYQDILAGAPELVTDIFKLEIVYYHVTDRKFFVIARDCYQTIHMLNSAIEQLVCGYGFARQSTENPE